MLGETVDVADRDAQPIDRCQAQRPLVPVLFIDALLVKIRDGQVANLLDPTCCPDSAVARPPLRPGESHGAVGPRASVWVGRRAMTDFRRRASSPEKERST